VYILGADAHCAPPQGKRGAIARPVLVPSPRKQLPGICGKEGTPGGRSEIVIDELRRYRAMFKEQGREDLEDLILDAMDIVTGWAAPDLRV
jgi:hypothetical protein